MGVIAFLFFSLKQEEKARPPIEPPQARPMASESEETVDIKALVEHLQKNPRDIKVINQLAHTLLKMQMLKEAEQVTLRALEVAPQDAEALIHNAVIRAGKGETKEGIDELQSILEKHPNNEEGWFFLGMLSMQSGDSKTMQKAFKRFVEIAPPGPKRDRIQAMLKP